MNQYFEKTNRKPIYNKQCRVCGDKATCFNFSGLSCETCKIFFRRNATKGEKLKCRREGNCRIDAYTRKCCPACRLKKCFAIGMRLKSQTAPPTQPSFSNQVSVIQSSKKLDLYSILEGDIKAKITQCDLESASSSSSETDGKSKAAAAAEESNAVKFNESEQRLLDEVSNASKVSFVDEDLLPFSQTVHTDFAVSLHFPAAYISQIITFCKNISAFNCLDSANQLAILKTFYFYVLSIRFSYYFIEEADGFLAIENDHTVIIKMNVLRSSKRENVTEEYRKIMKDLKAEMQNDPIIRDLLTAHSLFLHYDELSCREITSYHNSRYRHLLIKYLEQKFNKAQAIRKYSTLMKLLNAHLAMRDVIIELLKNEDENGNPVPHALIEIYNM